MLMNYNKASLFPINELISKDLMKAVNKMAEFWLGARKKISVTKYKGYPYVDIRKQYLDDHGVLCPSTQGITLRFDELKKFERFLDAIYMAIRELTGEDEDTDPPQHVFTDITCQGGTSIPAVVGRVKSVSITSAANTSSVESNLPLATKSKGKAGKRTSGKQPQPKRLKLTE
jgi:hypothetical protein